MGRPLHSAAVVSSFFYFPRLFSAVADWMSAILPHVMWPLSASSECRSEMCCTRFAEYIQDAKIRRLRTIAATLSGYIFATDASVDNPKQELIRR